MFGEVRAVVPPADIEGGDGVAVGRGEGLAVGEGDGEEEVYRSAVCVGRDLHAGERRLSGVRRTPQL